MTTHRTPREVASSPPTLPTRIEDEPWEQDAICRQTDPESFFPDRGVPSREAKRTCSKCPVRAECLLAALSRDERFGIWGGLSERERRKLKKDAGCKAAARFEGHTQELMIIKLLYAGQTRRFIAHAIGLEEGTIDQTAQTNGWPDTAKLRTAIDKINARITADQALRLSPGEPYGRTAA